MVKKLILNLVKKFTLYFIPKTIVVTNGMWAPDGFFVKASLVDGKKYITIAVTNRAVKNSPNAAIIYHVPEYQVIGFRKTTTPFEIWLYGMLNKPCPKKYIKKLKH